MPYFLGIGNLASFLSVTTTPMANPIQTWVAVDGHGAKLRQQVDLP